LKTRPQLPGNAAADEAGTADPSLRSGWRTGERRCQPFFTHPTQPERCPGPSRDPML